MPLPDPATSASAAHGAAASDDESAARGTVIEVLLAFLRLGLTSFGGPVAHLGAVMPRPFGGWAGGLALLAVTFVPAFLLVASALPYWESLRRREGVRRALAGVNAAVVGVLLAALYDPVWTGAIRSKADVAWGLAAFGLLVVGRVSPVVVVALAAVAGWLLGG